MRVVAVMWGGPGLEHDVSRLSGEQVLANLDPERYDPVAVHVRPDGAWQVGEQDPAHPAEAILRLRERGVDAAFIAMHGPYGEDGTIQGFPRWPITGIPALLILLTVSATDRPPSSFTDWHPPSLSRRPALRIASAVSAW